MSYLKKDPKGYYHLVEKVNGREHYLKYIGKDPKPYLEEVARGREVLAIKTEYPDLALKNATAALQEHRRRKLPKSIKLPDESFDLIYADPPWNVSTNNEIKRTSRRLAVKKHFGFQDIFTDDEYLDREEVEIWIIRNQFGRRNLSPYQRSVLALRLEDIFRERAKERQVRKPVSVQQISAEPIETRHELAKIAHVSHDTIYKDLAECKNGENTENGKPDPLRIAYITEGQINYRRFPGVSLLRGIYRTNKE